MRKLIVIVFLIIIIPYFVVTLLIKDNAIDQMKFYYVDNLKVRVMRHKTNQIEEIPLEEYVTGVLAGEMPISFEKEALKAQAVAARSYVLKKIEANREKEYDVIDTVQNQVYLDSNELKTKFTTNYVEDINKLKTIVKETKGEYLTYDGQIAQTFFFSTSTGMTENSEEVFTSALPYLRSVKSEWDKDVSPVFNDTFQFSLNDFYQKLNLPYSDTVETEIIKTTSTGRVKEVRINNKTFSGSEVYTALGLRSTFFNIDQINSNVIVHTKGYGHGVGMSQYGALGMAKQGYMYDKILKYYYQGTEIKKI